MSLLDLLRRAPGSDDPEGDAAGHDAGSVAGNVAGGDAEEGLSLRLPHVLAAGALTALGSATLVMLLVLAVWASATPSRGTLGDSALAGVSWWLLVHGAPLALGAGTLSITPLLLTLAQAALLVVVVRWVADRSAFGWPAVVGTFLCGYAALLTLATLLAGAGPLPPSWPGALVGILCVPGLVAAWLLGEDLLEHDRVPVGLRRAVRPAIHGAVVLIGLGSLFTLVALGFSFDSVRTIDGAVAAGGVGGAALWLLQIGALPNLGLWVASFCAGPGFQVVDGARTTWSGSASGLLPLLPVLGALPRPGAYSAVTMVSVLVPVAVGAVIGWRSLREVARLSSLRTKAWGALWAAIVAAVVVGGLDALGGGALGGHRLADVGAPAGWLTGALAVEFLVGALLAVTVDAWRLRR